MKFIAYFGLLALCLMSVTCGTQPDEKQNLLFGKTWLHSREEDTEDIQVYRPNTYQFPPSRGRTGFGIEKDGTFRLLSIAPTDGLEEHPGKWENVKKGLLRVTFSKPELEHFELELVSVTDEVLKVRRTPVSK